MQLKSIITSFFLSISLLINPVLTADNQHYEPIVKVGPNFDNDFLSLGVMKNGTAIGIALASTGYAILRLDRSIPNLQNNIATEFGWSLWLYGASTLLYVASTNPAIQHYVNTSHYHRFTSLGVSILMLISPALLL